METAGSGGAASLAEALFGRARTDEVWSQICFDSPPAYLECRRGEEVLEALEPVEDTKGNNGEPGTLRLTNLRLTWAARRSRRTNISVGYSSVASIAVRPANSRLKGATSSLYILTRQNQQRFEFIFTALSDDGGRGLPAVVQAVLAAFEASRPYRELRLRGALLVDKELKLLPREAAYSRVNGVFNLSSETGSLGTLYITNVRVVWFSNLAAASFNVSIPYLQIKAARVVTSAKFGPALAVETTPSSGGYVLGFRVEPRETLDYVHKEIALLLHAFASSPVFGVEYDAAADIDVAGGRAGVDQPESDVIETGLQPDAWAAYYMADGGCEAACAAPVFCAALGLAIEPPRDGATIQQLWDVL